MGRPNVEIEGRVFEPKKLGVFGELMAQVVLFYRSDKIGWIIPDPFQFKIAVEGMRLQSFYGKPAADAFDEATREKPWRWRCIGDELTRRKVLLLNP